jgi:hypothetical protein
MSSKHIASGGAGDTPSLHPSYPGGVCRREKKWLARFAADGFS